MASLIPGYEYDIFISYRQKDNQPTPGYGWQSKGDRWVSNFVEALKTELDATFKEDVTVYFDENPHDRLQETHNVDKSLEGKLKCLVFIPILSQTYCDQASYAWQYEFLTFLRMAKTDLFGKDVKLKSGNVACRVLPVRIHDLDEEDKKLFEKETESVLRALDFVFRTPSGVNRPLRPEDQAAENLNKTLYRDQINKVARAVKEIIQAMKSGPAAENRGEILPETVHTEYELDKIRKERGKPVRISQVKIISGILSLAAIIIAIVLFRPMIIRTDSLERLKKSAGKVSIAIMPFQNMTGDTLWNIWQNGIQNELISSLTNSEDLRVRQTESINTLIQSKGVANYASLTPSLARTISRKLNADLFVLGSIKRVGATLRVNAQLIDSDSEDTFKSFQVDGTGENIIHLIDSLSAMVRNFLLISLMEKNVPVDFHQLVSTRSIEAYRYYMYGNQAYYKNDYSTAREWFEKATYIDANFTEAIRMLGYTYQLLGLREETLKCILRNYAKRDQMPIQERIWADIRYAQYFETPYEQIKHFKLLIALNDEMPIPHGNIAGPYEELGLYEQGVKEREKELEIYKKWGVKPRWVNTYTVLGSTYHKMGLFKKEKRLYRKAEKDFPGDPLLIRSQAILAISEGNTKKANEYLEQYTESKKAASASEVNIANNLALIYEEAGLYDEAEEYYRKVLAIRPEDPVSLNNLAWFLIERDRNIDEGLELIEEASALGLEEFYYADCKGLGLFKQAKYEEALELLERAWNCKPRYYHDVYLRLEAARKAAKGQ